MRDYEVGRGRPPIHSRFKKGNQEWKKREAKRKEREKFLPARDLKAVLRSMVRVERNGKPVNQTRLEAHVDHLISEAQRGDIAAANDLLSFRLNAEAIGDMQDLLFVFGPDDRNELVGDDE
jgi:hypothetical protein